MTRRYYAVLHIPMERPGLGEPGILSGSDAPAWSTRASRRVTAEFRLVGFNGWRTDRRLTPAGYP